MLTNPRDAFTCQSRSPNMVPFNVVSCRCSIVTLSLRSAVSAIFDFKNVVALKSGSEVNHDVKRKRRVVFLSFCAFAHHCRKRRVGGTLTSDRRKAAERRRPLPVVDVLCHSSGKLVLTCTQLTQQETLSTRRPTDRDGRLHRKDCVIRDMRLQKAASEPHRKAPPPPSRLSGTYICRSIRTKCRWMQSFLL